MHAGASAPSHDTTQDCWSKAYHKHSSETCFQNLVLRTLKRAEHTSSELMKRRTYYTRKGAKLRPHIQTHTHTHTRTHRRTHTHTPFRKNAAYIQCMSDCSEQVLSIAFSGVARRPRVWYEVCDVATCAKMMRTSRINAFATCIFDPLYPWEAWANISAC